MLKSMTGYGRTKGTVKGHQVDVEIRTLNSKFLDVQLKVPRLFQSKELEIRSLLSEGLTRGKLAVTIDMVQDAEADSSNQVNHELFKKYYKEFEALAKEVNANQSDLFRLALHSPDVMNGSALDEEELEEQWKGVKKLLAEAIVSCNNFRQQEGASLAAELANYIDSIGSFLEQVKALDPERAEAIRERILKHQKEIESSDEFDKNRFEQEMIYYIEKLDISEELVRLSNHLSYFKEVMGESDSQGKKLGFISQEIGREINTIGSKANYAPIQKLVVGMKDELEKIKEQLLNII
ncbi:YicC/YloC family endoribonuclease [Roseivirga sp. UBA838]|uniref:YicC/YloC family endoribonuclease n=1 Tax=Roseivirga sp. UBA838 TaxID=1947393 RepID=UPI00257A0823|nr:YicC/YloC family endoribonuclease [Roseivirga sp. UBA838]